MQLQLELIANKILSPISFDETLIILLLGNFYCVTIRMFTLPTHSRLSLQHGLRQLFVILSNKVLCEPLPSSVRLLSGM